MGSNHSKKPHDVQRRETLVINNNNNNNNNNQNLNNNVTNHNNNTNSRSRIDRQYIETIKNDLRDTPELFVLNNMVMSVMFFEDYKKLLTELLETKLEKSEDIVAPDIIFDKVSENVLTRPHHGPKKFESEPLVPKRFFVLNESVRVIGTTEDRDETFEDDKDKTYVRIEESRRKGYVRLRELNTNIQRSRSPVLQLDSSPPNSRSSTDSSDTAYNALTNLRTPKPIDIINHLEKQASKSTGVPKTCISYRKIKKISWDPDELKGESISEDDLYDTVAYINSKSYMKHLENDIFLNEVAGKIGLTSEDIYNSQIIQERISCNHSEEGRNTPYEIIPSIKANWPLEQTLKFLMKGERSTEGRKRYIFPTYNMIQEIRSLGCVLLPKGYRYKTGERNDADIEWELSFPQAQRYLENFMSHAQMKSLLILLALHKTFIEPKTQHLGLSTDHIRNFLLLECEENFTDWPEHRLGTKLMILIKHLNGHLCKARPVIPDFFVTDKNTLSEVPTRKIRLAQKALDEILQAPVMYFMKALRNLRYANGKSFFPPFDFKNLHTLLKKSGLEFSNPQLLRQKRAQFEDPEMILQHFEDSKRRLEILRKRREEKERESNLNDDSERRGSVDSIDINWLCEKNFDLHKKRALLKFFIEIFLDIAKKGLIISSKKTVSFYLKQAYYLTKILQEECPAFADEAREFFEAIRSVDIQCEQKEEKKHPGFSKNVDLSNSRPQRIQSPQNKLESKINGQNGLPSRKSVTFIEAHQQKST